VSTIPYSKLNQFLLFYLLIPIFFGGFALSVMPIEQAFQFDTDEGIELIKAVLYSQGFTLYTEIWNEQPPLLTVLLSNWFDLFGKSITAARILTLSFATLLIWSFCQTLRICLGNLPAIIGTLLLSLSCSFLRLSVSVMLGVPSLALAMLSIYTLILYIQKPRRYLVVLSGSFLALSLQTKLFTLFLIPLLFFLLIDFSIKQEKKTEKSIHLLDLLSKSKLPPLVPHWALGKLAPYLYQGEGWREVTRIYARGLLDPALCWLVSLLIVFVLIGISFHSLSFEQLFQANLAKNVKAAFPRQNSFQDLIVMFLQDFDYVLLAVIGVKSLLKKKEGWHKLPLIWLVTIIIVLLNYQPIWYHHYLLVSIPLTWLATYGATLALEYFQQKGWYSSFKLKNIKHFTLNQVAAAFFIFSIVLLPLKLTIIQIQNHSFLNQSQSKIEVISNLLKYKKVTNWIFTDLPIYAFYADLNIPPEIAVFARKRLASGYLTNELLTSVMEKYHPEQIILGRFPEVQNSLQSYLNEKYLKIYQQGSTKHYLLRTLQN